jgi:hypothetical protein
MYELLDRGKYELYMIYSTWLDEYELETELNEMRVTWLRKMLISRLRKAKVT